MTSPSPRRYWIYRDEDARCAEEINLNVHKLVCDSSHGAPAPDDAIFCIYCDNSVHSVMLVREVLTACQLPPDEEDRLLTLYTVEVGFAIPEHAYLEEDELVSDPIQRFLLRQARHALISEAWRSLPTTPGLKSAAWAINPSVGELLLQVYPFA